MYVCTLLARYGPPRAFGRFSRSLSCLTNLGQITCHSVWRLWDYITVSLLIVANSSRVGRTRASRRIRSSLPAIARSLRSENERLQSRHRVHRTMSAVQHAWLLTIRKMVRMTLEVGRAQCLLCLGSAARCDRDRSCRDSLGELLFRSFGSDHLLRQQSSLVAACILEDPERPSDSGGRG